MPRPILIAAVAGTLLMASTAQALPARTASFGNISTEQLDATSTWAIVGAVLGMVALILLLGDSEDDLIPVSP
ncbi:MAG: hypothetical protein J7493_01120 [Porphyrobacter sp.]|nr:hypothetical protein [Porphyrobacter sp.]